jgi:hypothetical protein
VNPPEAAAVTVEDTQSELQFQHWTTVRWAAVGLYFAGFGVWCATYGIPVQRELVILWVCGGLVAASVGRPPRQILQVALDWLPIVAVLAVYDRTRGAADSLGIDVHVTTMIDFDEFFFFGQTPTVWLQEQFHEPGVLNWWDVALSVVYFSYFLVPFALAGYLWIRERPEFLRFMRRLVTLAIAGLITYILFPAAPPWMAAEQGLLGPVDRFSAEGFSAVGVETVGLFSKGQASVNLVAAVPSLHTAFTVLVALFLWGKVRRRRLRPLLLLYPLAMSFTLIATGEHYFFDIVLGWIYAGAVMAAWGWWERRRALAEPPPGSLPDTV